MKSITKALEDLVWVSQLGLSLMMPLLLLLGGAYWMTTQWPIGVWIYIPAFLLGIGAGGASFMRYWRLIQRKMERKAKEETISFNQHD